VKKTIPLALFLFAAPILALTVSFLCEQKMNVELRKAIAAKRADATETELRAVTVRRLLADRDPADLGPIRSQVRHFDLMRVGSLALIGVVLLYYATLWTAGRLAVRDRALLLHVFKPGFYASSLLLAATTVVNAALLLSAIYYGESYLFGVLTVNVVVLIGIGALAGSFITIKGALTSRKNVASRVFGKVLRQSEHPRIWREVRDLATRTGSLPPENIVMGLNPTFFVTETDVACLDGTLKGRTLFFSAPFCRLLGSAHFQAILGHELGHFKGKDTEFSKKFYPVYRGLMTSLAGLERAEGTMRFAVLPTMMMLGTFLSSFATAEAKLSRERELAADAVAVSVTDPRTFAVALTRIIICAPFWQLAEKDLVRTLREGHSLPNVSSFIAAQAVACVLPATLGLVGQGRMFHPTDSHPPTSVRLEAIGMDLDVIRDEVLQPGAGPSAIDLVDRGEAVEEALSKAYRESLAWRYDLSVLGQPH
jgi:Zn-dependent protease with chaperone function